MTQNNSYLTNLAREIIEHRGRFIQRDLEGTSEQEFTRLVAWWVEEEGHYDISDKLIPVMFQLWNDEYQYRNFN